LVYLLMVKQNLLSHLDPNLKQKFVSIESKTKKIFYFHNDLRNVTFP
jgi:hypothetical protein